MPTFLAVLEAAAGDRLIVEALTFELPFGSSGIDVVRAGEDYARRRGWRCLVVATGLNGTVLRGAKKRL